jgi:hypothetical protein
MHEASGEGDASYENLDLTGTECQRINQAAMDWALSVASTSAKTNYLRYGQTIVMGHDAIQENGGLWIYQPLTEKENTEKTVRTITGLALPLDEDHYISIFRDMHYCKLLSPFRALEIIYVDSQYAHGGYQTANELFLQ